MEPDPTGFANWWGVKVGEQAFPLTENQTEAHPGQQRGQCELRQSQGTKGRPQLCSQNQGQDQAAIPGAARLLNRL